MPSTRYTKNFGVPQHRPRIYIIGLRKDVMLPAMSAVSHEILQQLIELQIQRNYISTVDFRKFLEKCGFPIQENEQDFGKDAGCTCAMTSTCPLHPCSCKECKQHGPEKMKCL